MTLKTWKLKDAVVYTAKHIVAINGRNHRTSNMWYAVGVVTEIDCEIDAMVKVRWEDGHEALIHRNSITRLGAYDAVL